MKEIQKEVDAWVQQYKIGYFKPQKKKETEDTKEIRNKFIK